MQFHARVQSIIAKNPSSFKNMKKIIKYTFAIVFILLTLWTCGCTYGRASYPDPAISIENMKGTVQYLSTINPPRSHEHLDSLNSTAGYISKKFEEYGLKPTEQKFVVNGKTYVNIIASAGPREGSRLIVGAHYDVCGDQPGADDNASAVAGLLEIARFAKNHESELPYRVDFVAYTLEEPPFFKTAQMGSYVHAEYLHNNKIPVRGMICLEMIGYFSDKKGSQTYPSIILKPFYPSEGNFIGIISNFGSSTFASHIAGNMRNTALKTRTLKAPSFVTGVDFSDHLNYWKFGYAAVMITDTAFFRNHNYHEETDTMDTLDFNKMREVVNGVCWSIINIK